MAIVSDVLFKGSIGRIHSPRGDPVTLIRAITTRLWPICDETQFVPGQSQKCTFGAERRSNPVAGDAAPAQHPVG